MAKNNLVDFLGQFGEKGAIISHPKRFVGGSPYIHQNKPAKTRVLVGDGYFYLLPIGIGALKPEAHDEFVEAAKALVPPQRSATLKVTKTKEAE